MSQISRRNFMKLGAMSAVYLAASSKGVLGMSSGSNGTIRLGGPVFKDVEQDPEAWVLAHKAWDTVPPIVLLMRMPPRN